MKVIGLTGGIASGKSTVARLFRELGARTLSADEDARAVLAPGSPTLTAVLTAFPDAANPDGSLNRAALAARIFADPEARSGLEQIMHPAIFGRMQAGIDAARADGEGVMIYEVPLLYEKSREVLFDAVIVTFSAPAFQAQRLQEREKVAGRSVLTDEAIAERLSAQLPGEEKARRADYVIRTDVPLSETTRQVQQVWEQLHR